MYEVSVRKRVLPMTEEADSREWTVAAIRNQKKNALGWARSCEKQGLQARVYRLYATGERVCISQYSD